MAQGLPPGLQQVLNILNNPISNTNKLNNYSFGDDKRRQCRFIFDWTLRSEFSSWLRPVSSDPHKGWCLFCKKVFPINHGGLHDVKTHAKGKRHLLLEQHYSTRNRTYNGLNSFQALSNWNQETTAVSPNSTDFSQSFPPATMTSSSNPAHFRVLRLKWKLHKEHLQSMFTEFFENECFCDVTLACEGRSIRAHKVMLSSCSTFFDEILSQHTEFNPIVVFKDVKFEDLKILVQFIYKGEVKVDYTQLPPLLEAAKELRIKGLTQNSASMPQSSMESPIKHQVGGNADVDDNVDLPPIKKQRTDASLSSWDQQLREMNKLQNNSNTSNSDAEEDIDKVEGEVHDDVNTNSDPTKESSDLHDNSEQNESEDDYDDMPMPIAPETVYANSENEANNSMDEDDAEDPLCIDTGDDREHDKDEDEEEREDLSKDDNDNDQNNNFDMPGMPAHLTNSAFTAFLDNQDLENNNSSVTSGMLNSDSEKIDYSKYSYVLKMNDFLDQGGKRPLFWEEPTTRKMMEAIRNKELEMKIAAEILGVSYGTLYGRYRDAFGCLKHPYRIQKEFTSEQGPNEVLSKLQRKELSLFRAAELLNVTVTTLANYISTLKNYEDYFDDLESEQENMPQKTVVAQNMTNLPLLTQKLLATSE